MDLKKAIGLGAEFSPESRRELLRYINLRLAALGCALVKLDVDTPVSSMMESFLSHHRESARLLSDHLCPADTRIQEFLADYLAETGTEVKFLHQTFSLDSHGISRELSLPAYGDYFRSDIVETYRIKQGVLHNPKSDRRTTKGSFHIVEGGLPIPDDKIAVPKSVFAKILNIAFAPPRELMKLPITSDQDECAELFVSLLLRPIVCPEAPGFIEQKSMEVRFFAPGNLVGNLDFVESIFGNAGDPYLPENDAGLDVAHWTKHTECMILAPHLVSVKKIDLGLPKWDEATERQRRDGICWKSEDELYNDGMAFKITCRDERGVIVTIIADNYFGYCKKEVKTQIGYSANLFGLCEEEHAGGALVYPSYDLGDIFYGDAHVQNRGHNFEEVKEKAASFMDVQPEGYGIDKRHPDILYVSEKVHFDLHEQRVSWPTEDGERSLKLLPGKTYVRPSGYKVRMEKPPGKRAWRLVGTGAEPTLCHKPCTVSGGGKSEISKPITDAIIQGPVFSADFKRDFDEVEVLINRDYADRFRDKSRKDDRKILSLERSLGSVIKLLTPAPLVFTDEYNARLEAIPQHIKELVFVVKRFYVANWGEDWRGRFNVDIVDGTPGNKLKLGHRELVSNYLRVGFAEDGSWRVFGLRKDFSPAEKQSQEDDITASVVVPTGALNNLNPDYDQPSLKFVQNCEYRFFQRPDDAIHRGYDKQTELDFTMPGNFVSNYEPLTPERAKELVEDSIGFGEYTEPLQKLIREIAETGKPSYFVAPSHPRIVEGKPSKNPRYLQTRPDLLQPREACLMETATRLKRRMAADEPVHTPVNATLPGRRNNPPDPKNNIRPLAVYNPIHYMELPELFMEFICSMTGKSPSTTGAGSEGAMTKGPFNALLPIHDLNAALVSYLTTGYSGFVTAAGYVGPTMRVDHDISMLIPELWCRMGVGELDPQTMIDKDFLEKCEDVESGGTKALSSRLGYRITRKFVRTYFGRIFHNPHKVITDEMLRPEMQGMEVFIDGMSNIVETQARVANAYFADGSIELACPPLRALLHIMRDGQFDGKGLEHAEIRGEFTRENMLESGWYAERLNAKQVKDIALWERHEAYLNGFLGKESHSAEADRLGVNARLDRVRESLEEMRAPAYVEKLRGTIGVAPAYRPGS
jgi:hypothetical protein